MASPKEILQIGGREVAVSNPEQGLLPGRGLHQARPRPLLPGRGATGALSGVRGRPMALKRFVDGIAKEPFFQKRAPDNTPDWIRDRRADVPVRADGRRDRRRRRGRPRLGRQPRLHRPQPAPGPRRRPRPSGRAAGRPRPGPGRAVVADPRRGDGLPRGPRGGRPRRLAQDVGVARHPHQRPDRARLDLPGGPPGGPRPGPRRGAAGARRRDLAGGGRRSATASSSTTTRTPRTGRSRRPTPSGRCPTRASRRR